ncbi:hypothetical protein [Streptomyces sp. NRRL B-24720]|uniref:hypothetical protein n=1 Tax=Streptomyces sp. NRRL B-24720 TaxID=1476876 RepID=UPI0004CAE6D0|nr:hypothetical protein [Streptomyces sp. NRRL B-24720]
MTDQPDLTELRPLARVINETVHTTPVRLGAGGTDDLISQLTVKVAAYIGHEVIPATDGMGVFVCEVDAERQRQLKKFGDQRHPDGTGDQRWRDVANHIRGEVDDAARLGRTTWNGILREEVFEAIAESDPVKLRAELLQVAAVCAAWVSDIDRRTP